ncbi:MAG: hypothetical protein V1684_00005, partial [bacterium]
MNNNFKPRKLNRLKEYDYSQEGWYFVTICTNNKECFFGEIINSETKLLDIGLMAQKCWWEIPAHFPNAELDEFIVMPNHIHGIIVIKNLPVGNNNHCSDNNHRPNDNDYSENIGNK